MRNRLLVWPGRAARGVGFFDMGNCHVRPPKQTQRNSELTNRAGIMRRHLDRLLQFVPRFVQTDEAANEIYEKRFGAYLRAKAALNRIESRPGPIEAKQQGDRTAEKRREFNTLKDELQPGRRHVAQEEHKLYEVRPEVTKADVRKIFSDYSGVPLSNLSANKLERVSSLELDLGAEIFGQDAPVKAVAKVWCERELGVTDPSRPAGCCVSSAEPGWERRKDQSPGALGWR